MYTLLLSLFALAAVVEKVEPPGWWPKHSINPVRIMLSGRNLADGPVRSLNARMTCSGLKASANGRYAFFNLKIAPQTPPGRYRLRAGAAEFEFEVQPPLDPKQRFSGVTTDDVLYLIMPDRFANGNPANDGPGVDRTQSRAYHGGDLAGILARLPYLRDLGVTALWLTPLYDNTGNSYHGYHAVDMYKVEERFGSIDELKRLVDEAHRLGMKVILDQVANHVGPRHPWTAEPPTATWLNGTRDTHDASAHDMWTLIDPYGSPDMRRRLLQGWFVNQLPDLNQQDAEASRYLIQNTLWWIGTTGIDAIRQDTVPYVPKSFWSVLNSAIRKQYPTFDIVGEVFSRDPLVAAYFEDAGFHLFDFPLEEQIRRVFAAGERLSNLPATLARDSVYRTARELVTFIGSHDVPRFAQGATVNGLKNAFTFLITTRGIPMIYYGDEIGMKGGGDPDNRRDFPGHWPGESYSRTADEQAVLDHVRGLLQLRKAQAALRGGSLRNLYSDDKTYAYLRESPGHASVLVILGEFSEAARKAINIGTVTSAGVHVLEPASRKAVPSPTR